MGRGQKFQLRPYLNVLEISPPNSVLTICDHNFISFDAAVETELLKPKSQQITEFYRNLLIQGLTFLDSFTMNEKLFLFLCHIKKPIV
jgi:hypothetical protein